MLEHYNQLWFTYLNAATGLAGWRLAMSIMLAEWIIWLIPAGLVGLWLTGEIKDRQAAVQACLAAGCALLMNQAIGLAWFHPRPFMDHTGHTFLPHVPDSSFPSDHVTLMLSVGLALYVSAPAFSRRAGILLLALSPMVAWARIFLGVHYPFDMLGAIAVALASTLLAETALARIGAIRLTAALELLYRRFLAFPIALGWIRP